MHKMVFLDGGIRENQEKIILLMEMEKLIIG